MTNSHLYLVAGMTCEHCVLSVTEEIAEVGGVERVDVELATGRVLVHGSGFADAEIRDAVAAAGYEVAA
jgi:copper chaperone